MVNKLMALDEAVRTFVKDRSSILFTGMPLTRFANVFCKEILRQKKAGNININDLMLMGPSINLGGDLLVAEGVVDSVISTFTGHERVGISRVLRDSLEKGIPRKVKWEDESNLTMNLKLMAGALNMPFIPSSSGVWGDMRKPGLWDRKLEYPKNILMDDPYGSNKKVALLQALYPDLSIVSATFADIRGNAVILGALYYDNWSGKAGKKIVVLADRIVDNAMCRQFPNMVTVPGIAVDAVIPWYMGAWPCNSIGHYAEDLEHFSYFMKNARGEALREYIDEYVYSWKDYDEYMKLIGEDKIKELESTPTGRLADPFREWIYSRDKVEGLMKK